MLPPLALLLLLVAFAGAVGGGAAAAGAVPAAPAGVVGLAERDGESIAEVGPGAILGEMALLEGGRRTATLRAAMACRVAVVPSDRVDRSRLQHLAEGREQGSHGEGTSR
jgi:Cyclic nucleotide-binding domain